MNDETKIFPIDESYRELLLNKKLRIYILPNDTDLVPEEGELVKLHYGKADEMFFAEVSKTYDMGGKGTLIYFTLLPTMTKNGESYFMLGADGTTFAHFLNDTPKENEPFSSMMPTPFTVSIYTKDQKFWGEIGIEGFSLRNGNLSFLHATFRKRDPEKGDGPADKVLMQAVSKFGPTPPQHLVM